MFAPRRKYLMDKLLTEIKEKQRTMIELGLKTGFNSPETIQVSQELDVLIVKYQRLKEKKNSNFIAKLFDDMYFHLKQIIHKFILNAVLLNILKW